MAKVTIKTVAQALGASASTVSNAYNKPGQLSAVLLLPLSASDEVSIETVRSANIDALTSLCLPDDSPAVAVAR